MTSLWKSLKDNKYLILVFGIASAVLFFTRFTAWPEMIAWPYLILNGLLPYKAIAAAHTPALLLDLAGFYALFGVGVVQLKVYSWMIFAFTFWLVAFVAKSFWSSTVTLVSVVSYSLLFVVFEGNGVWFDHTLAPIALLLYWAFRRKKYFLAGLVFVLGVFTKQTFVYFLVPLALEIIQSAKNKAQSFFSFGKGFVLAGIAVLVLLHLLGVLYDFYFWTFVFGVFYLPIAPGQIHFPAFRQLLYVVPLGVAAYVPGLLIWVVAGSMGVYPRWELFHFQPALPFVAMAVGVLFTRPKLKKYALAFIVITSLLFVRHISNNLSTETRFYESEVQQVVDYVKEQTLPGEQIYVANYWDSVYAYTETIPATDMLVPHLSWYLNFPNIEQQMVKQLVATKPSVIVQGKYLGGLSAYQPTMIVEFIERNYVMVKEFENVEVLRLIEK